jgi:hypothetical protein
MKKGRTRTLQSAKYIQKKRKKRILYSLLITLGIFLVLALLIFILRIDLFKISKVNIIGTKTLSEEELKKVVLESLQGEYLYFIPRSSFIFYSKSDIELNLKEKYKKIHSVNIVTDDLNNISINIGESIPEAIVCDGFREEESKDKCYFVDRNAYVFEPITGISEGVYVKYYVNHTGSNIKEGATFMDVERFKELEEFIKNIKEANVSVVGILVNDSGNYEMYVKNPDQSITVVYFDDRTPFSKTSSNFLAFWQSALDNKLGIAKTPIFDYINLRFGNNIFYTTRE